MCKFSDENRAKLGNLAIYLADNTGMPSKTKLLKLIYLVEESFALKHHTPFLALPFEVWQAGPVAKDVFIDLSDGPFLLKDYVEVVHSDGNVSFVRAVAEFDEDEFSDNELVVMRDVVERFGSMSASELVRYTHREGSLWHEIAERYGLLEAFERKECNNSSYVIDFSKAMDAEAAGFYNDQLEEFKAANIYNL